MTAPVVTDHGPLLTLAAKAQGAADDGDAVRLERYLRLFVHGFVGHLHRFTAVCSRLRPADAARLRRGQVRVAGSARRLLREAAGGCAAPGRCSASAEALHALLTLQDREERLALRSVPVPVGAEVRAVRR